MSLRIIYQPTEEEEVLKSTISQYLTRIYELASQKICFFFSNYQKIIKYNHLSSKKWENS